jgi:peptidoglycan/LPS O-acetylase OafA/YrhL
MNTDERGSAVIPERELPYNPPLDGVRALAIALVLCYHGGATFVPGGFIGVDTFFVLSGFLITSILVREHDASGRIALRPFWARRARRLLPALVIMVGAVLLWVHFFARGDYPELGSDAQSVLFYFANWHFSTAASYVNLGSSVSPFLHTWSLAIEEQFYLVWPLVLLGAFRLGLSRAKLLSLTLLAAAGSAALMVYLYDPSQDPTAIYYNTATRAQALLVGAALALAVSWWTPAARRLGAKLWGALAAVGFAGVVVLSATMTIGGTFTYEGGLTLAALCAVALVGGVTLAGSSVAARCLSLRPIRYIGRISYGLYLWHWPIFVGLDGARTGLNGPVLFMIRLVATFIVAVASFHMIEMPIRRGALRRSREMRIEAGLVTTVVLVAALFQPTAAAPAPLIDLTAALSFFPGATPRLAAAPPGPPVRVLLVGDSVPFMLGNGLGLVSHQYGIALDNMGLSGCALEDSTYRIQDFVVQPPPQCADRPAAWTRELKRVNPQVVVFLARLDIVDRLEFGNWVHIGQSTYDSSLRSDLGRAIATLSSTGARVVLATTPYYSSGETLDGSRWPEDAPWRVRHYNVMLREVAAEHPGVVTVLDLNRIVDPEGHYQAVVNGVEVRSSDGVHFTWAGDFWLAPQILPQLRALGMASRCASVVSRCPTHHEHQVPKEQASRPQLLAPTRAKP